MRGGVEIMSMSMDGGHGLEFSNCIARCWSTTELSMNFALFYSSFSPIIKATAHVILIRLH